jgi:hypothetical protein
VYSFQYWNGCLTGSPYRDKKVVGVFVCVSWRFDEEQGCGRRCLSHRNDHDGGDRVCSNVSLSSRANPTSTPSHCDLWEQKARLSRAVRATSSRLFVRTRRRLNTADEEGKILDWETFDYGGDPKVGSTIRRQSIYFNVSMKTSTAGRENAKRRSCGPEIE